MKYSIFFLFIPVMITISNCHSWHQDLKFKEQHRPQFHFTPPSKWMNDPNGMVYYKGEYHLFYQYYPDGTVWGPMHWGHAISKDLVHWQHLPVALYPDSLGYIFSGSIVVDEQNTSGFQKGNEKPLIAIFTYHDVLAEKAGRIDYQTQGIAYSTDKGRTWIKYEKNPVINNPGRKDFRDPKVFWHKESGYWVMILASGNHVEFYRSANLKNWVKTGKFGSNQGSHGGVWECPDLFPARVGNSDTIKWVLIQSIGNVSPNGGSGTQYFIGSFNGKTFKNDNLPSTVLWLDYGRDNYAGVTWYNAPNNRRLFIGWMSNWQYAEYVPTQNWRSSMTLPRELTLVQASGSIRLFVNPVNELEILRKKRYTVDFSKKLEISSGLFEIIVELDLEQTTAWDIGIESYNSIGEKIRVGYNEIQKQFYIDRTNAGKKSFSDSFAGKHVAPRMSENKILKMHVFFDCSSIELFADNGSITLSTIFFPNENFTNIELYQQQGTVRLLKAEVFELKSIWK